MTEHCFPVQELIYDKSAFVCHHLAILFPKRIQPESFGVGNKCKLKISCLDMNIHMQQHFATILLANTKCRSSVQISAQLTLMLLQVMHWFPQTQTFKTELIVLLSKLAPSPSAQLPTLESLLLLGPDFWGANLPPNATTTHTQSPRSIYPDSLINLSNPSSPSTCINTEFGSHCPFLLHLFFQAPSFQSFFLSKSFCILQSPPFSYP